MLFWKVLKIIGILLLTVTVLIDTATVMKKLQTIEELNSTFKTTFSAIGYYFGYIGSLLLTFVPSLVIIIYAKKKITQKMKLKQT